MLTQGQGNLNNNQGNQNQNQNEEVVPVSKFNEVYKELQELKEKLAKRDAIIEMMNKGNDKDNKDLTKTQEDIDKMLIGIDWDKMGMSQEEWETLFASKPAEAINKLISYKILVGGSLLEQQILTKARISMAHDEDLKQLARMYPQAFVNPKAKALRFNPSNELGQLFIDEYRRNSARYESDPEGVRLLKIAVEERYKEMFGKEPEAKTEKVIDKDVVLNAKGFSSGGIEPAQKKVSGLTKEELAYAQKLVEDGELSSIEEYKKYKNTTIIE